MKSILTTIVLVLLLAVRKDAMAAPTYTIPVVVHVLYNTGYAPLSNVSDAEVLSQIDVLNQDFQLLNPDAANVPAAFAGLKADCQIQFILANRDPLGNATTGIIHKSTTKTLFSQSLNDVKFSAQGGDDAWPSNQYLNIWLVASMVLDQKQDKGYAQAPGGAAATDGIAMYFSSFGTVGSVNLDSKGHTATHLVGHWLNLQHPWGPGADNPTCTATDDVADTPPQSGPSGTSFPYAAPAFPHISCGNGPNGDLFMNFMDWTAEASRCMFTLGQKARMQTVLAAGGARASLASSLGYTPPVYTIPVVVHVLYIGAGNNVDIELQSHVSNAQVQSQIDVLNQDFRLLNADAANVPAAFAGLKADCRIQFCLAKRDPQGNATTGILRKPINKSVFSPTTNDAKFTALGGDDAWPGDQYLNIWVANISSSDPAGFGQAQFPGGPITTDGVVIHDFNEGHTTTHFVGHWLNLIHVWGPGTSNPTCTATDNVDDTPPQAGPNKGKCPAFPHISCTNGPNGDLFMNFMDGTNDNACRIMFTKGQSARMRAVLAPGGLRASLTSSKGCTPPCILPINAPTALNVTGITNTNATLGWTAPNASDYTVQWKPIIGSTWTTIPNIASAATYTLPALTPATAYSFKVLSNCNGTASAYSSEFAFATTCIPTGLNATNITTTSATLNWTAVLSASNYTLQWKRDIGNSWTTVNNILDTTYVFTGVIPGGNYFFKVSSNCGVGPSAYSSEAFFTTPLGPCPAPTGLSVTSVTDNTADFSWDSVPSATAYTMTVFTDHFSDFIDVPPYRIVRSGTTRSIEVACCAGQIDRLYPGVSYTARVFTTCSSGNTPESREVFFTTSGVFCSAPNLNVSNISTNSANFSWNTISNASSYTLQWKLATADTWNTVADISGTTYLLNGLLPGTLYNCHVKSNCTDPNSAYSDEQPYTWPFTFTTNFSCGTLTPSTNSITHNSATLNWTSAPSAFASSYTLQWKPVTGNTWNTVANIPGTTYLLPDLNPGTNYSFRVSSNCTAGPSAYTNPLGFTTTGCPDNFEPNESIAAARQVPVNVPVTANIGSTTDKDYFKFTTSSNAPFVKLSLTNLPANYELQLYNSSSILVGYSANTGTTSETVTFNYPYAGTYYAYVYGNSGANSGYCYNLKVQTSGLFGFKGTNVPNTNLPGKFTLYPNPTRGEVNFEYDSKAATTATISIIDQSGRTCKTIQLKLAAGQNKPVFNISDLSKGLYFVRMVANEETLTTKLFLER